MPGCYVAPGSVTWIPQTCRTRMNKYSFIYAISMVTQQTHR